MDVSVAAAPKGAARAAARAVRAARAAEGGGAGGARDGGECGQRCSMHAPSVLARAAHHAIDNARAELVMVRVVGDVERAGRVE